MIPLYVLASILTLFIGFRDAAGRNSKIQKTRYYIISIVRAFLFGQSFLLSLLGLVLLFELNINVIDSIAQRCLPIFGCYTCIVLCTFLPYTIPNWEVRSVVTVLVFGPLTMIQPIVIIIGIGYAVQPFLSQAEIIPVLVAGGFCLLFEKLLDLWGWSQRDAQVL
jgi:hypothetical protein